MKKGFSPLVTAASILALVPFLLLVFRSFAGVWPSPELWPRAASLRGWSRIAADALGVRSVALFSLAFSLIIGALSSLIATAAARALTFYSFRGKGLLETLLLAPLVLPPTAFAVGFQTLRYRLGPAGGLTALALAHLACSLPFTVKALKTVTEAAGIEAESAARCLGAGPWRAFLHGSLPLLAPAMIHAWALGFLFSFSQYFLTLLVSGGTVKTLPLLIMPLIGGNDGNVSSAYALLFVLLTALTFGLLSLSARLLARALGKELKVEG